MQTLQEFYQNNQYDEDFDYTEYAKSIDGIKEFYQPYATEIGFTPPQVGYYHFKTYFQHTDNVNVIYVAKNSDIDSVLVFRDDHVFIVDNATIENILSSCKHSNVVRETRSLTKTFNLQDKVSIKSFIGSGSNLKNIVYKDVIYDQIIQVHMKSFSISINDLIENSLRVPDVENITVNIWHHYAKHKEFVSTKKEEITNIIITSPFDAMPNIVFLKSVLTSIKMFSLFASVNTIIVADDIKKNSPWDTEHNQNRYKKYKDQLKQLIYLKKYPFDKTILLESEGWNGPTRNVQAGLDMVKTPYVFVNQHDVVLYDPANMIWNVDIEQCQTKIQDSFDVLRDNNDVKSIIFPRMWEIKSRGEFVYNNEIIRPLLSREPSDIEKAYHAKNRKDHPDETFIKRRNVWYAYTDNDFTNDKIKLYNIKGFSDAPLLTETNFMQYVLMDYARSYNPDRFLEDQIHEALINGLLPDITKHMFLFPIFCSHHINLQSKTKYIGQGTDEY